MLLMIDNYDSFTYNVVQYLAELGEDVHVYRNDEITVEGIEALKPERLVVSPGPCTPNEAGISMATIRHFAGKLPIFRGLSNPLKATRYHSLVIDKDTLPDCLEVTAWTRNDDGSVEEIMGVRHKTLPIEGVQFHPESIMTEQGHELLRNFLKTR